MIDIAYLQVEMSDSRSRRQARGFIAGACVLHEIAHGHRACRHVEAFVVATPICSRAIGINLDAIAFRIAEVEGLAHRVVGRALKSRGEV
ncbi:MAG: hypothetical protein ACOVLI_03475 [Rhabdaerophilum sp.]